MPMPIVKSISETIKDKTILPPEWTGKVVINGENMTYIASNILSKEAIIIDPVREDWDELLKIVKNDLRLIRFIGVFDTHTHADHISCAAQLAQELNVPLIQHYLSPTTRAHLRVCRDMTYSTAAGPLKILLTPGHTADGITPIWGPFLFGGDTILFGDTGRNDLPGGDPEAHWDSIQKINSNVPPEILVLPGHDEENGRSSSWSHQLEINSSLRMSKEEFCKTAGSYVGPCPKLLKESLYENFK